MTIDMLAHASTAVTGLVGAANAAPTVNGSEFRTATNMSPISAGIEIPSASAASFTEGLLSPNNMIDVLKLANTPVAQADLQDKPLWHRATLLDAIKDSKAFAAGDASAGKSLADRYTSQDIALIRASTGYNVVSKGGLTNIVDDDGNPLPSDISAQVWQMADNIEGARMTGALTGEVTPEYLKDMFAYYAKAEIIFKTDWLDRARAYLDGIKEAASSKV